MAGAGENLADPALPDASGGRRPQKRRHGGGEMPPVLAEEGGSMPKHLRPDRAGSAGGGAVPRPGDLDD